MRFERPILPSHVKAEAARRIEERYPVWKQVNALAMGGDPAMTDYIRIIRAASNALEECDPIPPDYRDDKYWL